jgi:flagellar M-ring protein FliF
MARLGTVWAQTLAAWRAIPIGRRMLFLAAVVLGVGAVVVFTMLNGAKIAPLMTDLSPEDVTAITSRLQAQQIPYELAGNGTAVLIPEDKVLTSRLALASEGLPKGGGVGFELFDETKLGRSRFEERLNYQRALEGELRRTIRQMSGVRDARVHLALPERSIFKERDREPRASVTLQLSGGRKLANENVQAIVHLVASSIEGLSADSVTVVDTSGTVLASGNGKHEQNGERLGHQRQLEDSLESRATAMLERAVGPGGATVRINAELDYSTSETTSETFDPDGSVLRSEQSNDEARQANSGDANGGIAGSRSNLAGTEQVSASGTSSSTSGSAGPTSSSNRRVSTRNYEISKTVSREVTATGKVTRLSVAVLVDAKRQGETATPRSREELDQLAELVKTAVGFDGRRGDHIEVQSAAFVDALGPEPETKPSVIQIAERSARPASAAVVAIAAVLAALVVMRRAKAVNGTARAEIVRSPMTVRELEAQLAGGGATMAMSGTMPAPHALNAKPDGKRAAAVVKGWLSES